MRSASAGSKPLGTAMASLGRGSDVHTTSVAFFSSLPPSIMALRLRSKSVAQSTWPLATAISLAACVAPSEYVEVLLGVDALLLEPGRGDEPAGGRADVGERDALALAALRPRPYQPRLAHHDGVVDRLAVVLRGGDGAHAGIVVGEDVAPRPHPRQVDLLVGERHGDAGPVGGRHQVEVAVELLGEVGEERLVRLLRLRRCRLQRPDAEAQGATLVIGSAARDRRRQQHHHGQQQHGPASVPDDVHSKVLSRQICSSDSGYSKV